MLSTATKNTMHQFNPNGGVKKSISVVFYRTIWLSLSALMHSHIAKLHCIHIHVRMQVTALHYTALALAFPWHSPGIRTISTYTEKYVERSG